MNKTKTNILAALIGILLGSIYIIAMASGALAQDTSGAQIQIEVATGCTWDGTPYASNLTVYDDEICILTGIHNVGAFNVLVENDVSSSNQAGGKLIIGADTVTETDITFGGTMTMNGILEIGVTGDPAINANLQIDGTSAISSIGSDGNLTILSNANALSFCGGGSDPCGNHTIELGSALSIGSATTTGIFTNNDDATTNTMTSVSLYGTFDNAAGTITLSSNFVANGSSDVTNDGILSLGTGTSEFKGTSTFDNTGTFSVPAGSNYVYYGSPTGSPVITNSGTFTNGYHYLYGSSSVTNTGTMNPLSMAVFSSNGLTNNLTGDINVTYSMVVNNGLVTNNNTATMFVDGTTYLYNNSTINNYSTWETDYLQFGILASINGGNFNNHGSLTFPTPSNPAINIYRGGDLNNEATGTIVVPNNIYMEGISGQVSTITNDNTTVNAIDVAGEIQMDAYSQINSVGYISTAGTNNISILDNNATIINGTTGYINLEGSSQVFDFDVIVTNDGTINTVSIPLTLNDTAILNNTANGLVDINGAGNDLTLNNSSNIYNAGVFNIIDATYLYDSAAATQTGGDFNTTYLYITDGTAGETTFTMSGGTVDVTFNAYVYDGGTVNNNVLNINGGILSAQRISIGIYPPNNGGIVNIDGDGRLNLTSTASNDIYKGTLDIKSTSTNANPIIALGTISIRGDATESSYMYMGNPNTAELRAVYVYEYGEYHALDGISDLNSYTFYLYGDTASQGLLYIENGAEVSGMYGLYMGSSSIRGGKVENYGTLRRGATSNMQLYMYNSAYIYNGGTGNINTYGGIIYMFPNENQPLYGSYSYIENISGGTIDTYNLQTNNIGHVIDNYGTFIVDAVNLGNTNGGIINNYNQFTFNGGGYMYVYNAGEFYNHQDALVGGTPQLTIDGASAKYYQAEGTDGATPAVKTPASAINVTNGLFENADYVNTSTLTVGTNGTYNGVLANTFSGAPLNNTAQDSITLVNGNGDVSVSGNMTIDGGASDEGTLQVTDTFNITATGIVTIDGTLEMQIPSTNTLNNSGILYSGDYSTVTLVDSPGMNTSTGSFTQFAGTLTATSINMNGGDMCLGSYSGTYPSGTCSNNALDPSKTISASGTAFDVGGDANVDMYNDLTLTNGDLNVNEGSTFEMFGASPLLDVQNNANVIVTDQGSSLYTEGELNIQGSGAGNHGYLKAVNRAGVQIAGTTNTIGSLWADGGPLGDITVLQTNAGSTLNLNDTHTDSTKTGVITVGLSDSPGNAIILFNGDVNMNSGTTQDIHLGVDSPANFGISGLEVFTGGSLQHTNGSNGTLDVNDTGLVYVQDDSNADLDMDINGYTYIGGHFDHQNSYHGVLIDGQFECQDYLAVESDGLLDVGLNGVTTVAGSTTDVYGDVELDGTLNAGDLTVYSGGIISSGDGNTTTTGEGCGPEGQFGCGISTNFYINADSLDVQSGGKISSDGVSILDTGVGSSIAHGGSYGGEGVPASGSPIATYGATKIAAPTYGTIGEGAGASDILNAHGGGGVNIYVAGNITIDGVVSANSGPITYDINYGTQTADFTIGAILTGPTGTAAIVADNDAGATGTLTINILTGSFSSGQAITDQAGGSATTTSGTTVNSGGGAGGTVIITQDLSAAPTTAIFTGSGTISANGGDATYPGGGGRIVIDSILLDDPDFGSYDFGETTAGTVEALGGSSGGGAYAAAGTMVYLGDAHNADDTLIIDQGTNAPTNSTRTVLTDTPTFDRIEVDNGEAVLGTTTTQTCFNLNTSGIYTTYPTAYTCTSLPDKPDSLHIETTSNGTNSGDPAEEPGYIAGKGNGVSDTAYDVQDITPVFAMYFRNPGDPTGDYNVAEIQVASDAAFTTLLWDATVGGADTPVTLTTPVSDGEWTEDIEYAGSSLSTLTTYYVRARFRETTGDNPGLWTHADYNDQYKFQVSSYTDLYIDNCNGVPANTSVVITQDGTTTGADMSNASGERYSYGSCDVHISTSESNWEVYESFTTGETAFTHTLYPGTTISNIDNASNDCTISTSGTGTEEEFAYNITTYTDTGDNTVLNSNVNSNTDCRLDTGTYPDACGNGAGEGYYNDPTCFFNLQSLATKDTILDTDLGTASSLGDGKFTMNFHSHAYQSDAGDYDTVVEVTITPNP